MKRGNYKRNRINRDIRYFLTRVSGLPFYKWQKDLTLRGDNQLSRDIWYGYLRGVRIPRSMRRMLRLGI